MSVTVDSCIQTASSHLNDWNQTFWIKENLINFLREAHRELQIELALQGIGVLKKKSSILALPIAATIINLSTTPVLPSDLLAPVELWERLTGSGDDFDEMKEQSWEPETQPIAELVYWAWRGESLNFVGATTARDVKIYYQAGIPLPIADKDPLGFIFAELFLAPRTAALAIRPTNQKAYESLTQVARERLDKIIRFNVKNQQAVPVRRRGYRRRANQIIIGR